MRLALNDRAFTLIELVVVMALIALTASFAVPQIANFLYADQLKVAVRRLTALIHQSSLLAQREQNPYLLRYIERERRFVVESEQRRENREMERTREIRLGGSVAVRSFWSWYGGLGPADEMVIRFSKNGAVEPTVLHLAKENGETMSLILSPFLGKVQLVDSYVVPDHDAFFQ